MLTRWIPAVNMDKATWPSFWPSKSFTKHFCLVLYVGNFADSDNEADKTFLVINLN